VTLRAYPAELAAILCLRVVAQGWSRRRIARALKLDRKTVRRYLNAASKSPTISTPGLGGVGFKIPRDFDPRRFLWLAAGH
jgi:DNA invertase Pin-like site-specific DNA recombinase